MEVTNRHMKLNWFLFLWSIVIVLLNPLVWLGCEQSNQNTSTLEHGITLKPGSVTVQASTKGGIQPILVQPSQDQVICSLWTTFILQNAEQNQGVVPTYSIEIYLDAALSNLHGSYTDIEENQYGYTAFTVTLPLPDQHTLWWRARAQWNEVSGPWTSAVRFMTEALAPVQLIMPINGTSSLYPRTELIVQNSPNHCHYELEYEFEVADDSAMFHQLAAISDGDQGEFELTSWVVDQELPEGIPLYWRCRVTSGQYVSKWSETGFFMVDTSKPIGDAYAHNVLHCGISCLDAVIYQDCTEALGEPDFWWEENPDSLDGFNFYGFVSLGIRGSLILDMGEGTEIINGDNYDFQVWQAVSREQFQIFVAERAGGPYYDLGFAGSGWLTGDYLFDPFTTSDNEYMFFDPDSWCYTSGGNYNGEIALCDVVPTGFEKIRFVRIVDLQPWGDLRKDCWFFDAHFGAWIPDLTAGADIDAVKARYMASE